MQSRKNNARVVYKMNACYIFRTTYFQIPVEEGEKTGLEAFWSLPSAHWSDWGQVTPQWAGELQLYTHTQCTLTAGVTSY